MAKVFLLIVAIAALFLVMADVLLFTPKDAEMTAKILYFSQTVTAYLFNTI